MGLFSAVIFPIGPDCDVASRRIAGGEGGTPSSEKVCSLKWRARDDSSGGGVQGYPHPLKADFFVYHRETLMAGRMVADGGREPERRRRRPRL